MGSQRDSRAIEEAERRLVSATRSNGPPRLPPEAFSTAELHAEYRAGLAGAALSVDGDLGDVTARDVELVRNAAMARIALDVAARLTRSASAWLNEPRDPSELARTFDFALAELVRARDVDTLVGVREHVEDAARRFARRADAGRDVFAVCAPLVELQNATAGVPIGGLCAIVGGPGSGKTRLVNEWALACAKRGFSTLLWSHLAVERAVDRLVAIEAGVEVQDVRTAHGERAPRAIVARAFDQIERLPLAVLDEVCTRPVDVLREIVARRCTKRDHVDCPVSLLVLDGVETLAWTRGDVRRFVRAAGKMLHAVVVVSTKTGAGENFVGEADVVHRVGLGVERVLKNRDAVDPDEGVGEIDGNDGEWIVGIDGD